MTYIAINKHTKEISCQACHRACIVISRFKSRDVTFGGDSGLMRHLARLYSMLPDVDVGIRLRDFRKDPRFVRYLGPPGPFKFPDGKVISISERGEFCSKACSMEFRSRITRQDPTVAGWVFDDSKEDPWAS